MDNNILLARVYHLSLLSLNYSPAGQKAAEITHLFGTVFTCMTPLTKFNLNRKLNQHSDNMVTVSFLPFCDLVHFF